MAYFSMADNNNCPGMIIFSTPEEPIENYLTVTIGFRCNNRCLSCMLRGVMARLQPVAFDQYRLLLTEVVREGRFTSLILSGAEATLEDDLPRYLELARNTNHFRHIRIQTNGRRLADYEYARALTKAGLDEAFVSVYGPNPPIHESLTRVPGSFDETIQGIRNLNELGVQVITNTVITRLNYQSLPEIVATLPGFPTIARMEFWHYWPMGETDPYDLLVANENLAPYLHAVITKARQMNQAILFKNIPECVLGEYADYLDNRLPQTIIDEAYWEAYRKNNFGLCPKREHCGAKKCMGLTAAYINKFNREQLIPL
jgi:MoaA/NifB/PqqE/SkfB family radical SAM enzyme